MSAASESDQFAWLAGRAAAKEAVRQLVRAEYGLDYLQADIELWPEEHGRLIVGGAWCASLPQVPLVSVANVKDRAVALATLPDAALYLGIQIAQADDHAHVTGRAVLDTNELNVLQRLSAETHDQRHVLGWCAKDAVARALGFDLAAAPQAVVIMDVDARRNLVSVALRGELAAAYPDLGPSNLIVYARSYDDLIVATTLCERVTDKEHLVFTSNR